jgi:hypothetical protein
VYNPLNDPALMSSTAPSTHLLIDLNEGILEREEESRYGVVDRHVFDIVLDSRNAMYQNL